MKDNVIANKVTGYQIDRLTNDVLSGSISNNQIVERLKMIKEQLNVASLEVESKKSDTGKIIFIFEE